MTMPIRPGFPWHSHASYDIDVANVCENTEGAGSTNGASNSGRSIMSESYPMPTTAIPWRILPGEADRLIRWIDGPQPASQAVESDRLADRIAAERPPEPAPAPWI